MGGYISMLVVTVAILPCRMGRESLHHMDEVSLTHLDEFSSISSTKPLQNDHEAALRFRKVGESCTQVKVFDCWTLADMSDPSAGPCTCHRYQIWLFSNPLDLPVASGGPTYFMSLE